MKTILLLPLIIALPAFAGSSKEGVAPAQSSEPCLFTWFAGGSVGYLTEFEEPAYSLHVGTDTCWKPGGWNVAFFAEIGYTSKDEDWSGLREQTVPTAQATDGFELDPGGDFSLGDLEDLLSTIAGNTPNDTSYDLDIMPITLNVKLERPLTGNLNAYFGGGLGVALVDLDVDVGAYGDFSDDDWVFVGQLFAGLDYNVTPSFEVYGGLRWIYFDDASFSDNGVGGTLKLDDDFLLELGCRYNF